MKLVDINSLKQFLNRLPTYQEKELTIDGQKVRDYKAIVYKNTNKVVAIVSKKYTLVQHSEIFNLVIDKLSEEYGQENINGWVEYHNTKAYLFITFDKDVIENDSEYKLGLVFSNSVDTTLSIWSSLFIYRVVCSNGLIQKNNLIAIKSKHMATSNIFKRIEQRLDFIIDRYGKIIVPELYRLRRLKDISIDAYDLLKKFQELHSISNKAYNSILRKTQRVDTLFNVYQAITNYFSNIRTINISKRVELIRKAYEFIYSYVDKVG